MDTTQLLKGVLDVAVLAVVHQEDGYGYDIVRRLRGTGLREVGEASVYGTLRRLYAGGALTSYVVPSEEGPHRKYYGITPVGAATLSTERREWDSFATIMQAILAPIGGSRIPDRSATSITTAPSGAEGSPIKAEPGSPPSKASPGPSSPVSRSAIPHAPTPQGDTAASAQPMTSTEEDHQ